MKRPRATALRVAAVTAATAVTAACGISTASTTSQQIGSPTGPPLTIGTTLSLTGNFAADGQAFQRGYQLWASNVNTNGGLLGRPVKLDILNDNSDPNKSAAEYRQLVQQDHVDLTLGPFSTLITHQDAPVLASLGYALPEGAGEGDEMFSPGWHNVFAVSTPVAVEMQPLTSYLLGLKVNRPATAAYAMVNDPFADPPVQAAQGILSKGGIRTVYSDAPNGLTQSGSQLTAAITAAANAIADRNPQVVFLGTVDVPSVRSFIIQFEKRHFNPEYLIASAGPDQGQAFISAVGVINANGIMVPNGWFGGFQNAMSHVMVQDYIAKYGGTASSINADVAEAYSAGQVLADAVNGTKGVNNAKIIAYLHQPNLSLATVEGDVRFDAVGRNILATANSAFIFQWQPGMTQPGGNFVQVLPNPNGPSAKPAIILKPRWGSG
ncbi:MAG TPA: ABC transporter substrate-binding protein [Streptosporangiaceae bacterium]|nr:ABC transporter substrate-binding protein [Streptosporangiaceae bacterium]